MLMKKTSDYDDKVNESVSDALIRYHNEMTKFRRKPNNYGTKHYVHQSEVHMIDFIGRHPGKNITELAEDFGMTKSAVSQVITKLYTRHFITKERYKKEIIVGLTEEGKKLFDGHQEYHKTQNQYSVFQQPDKYSTETKILIANFISEYIADLPKTGEQADNP